jgi:hypothetical protein
VCQGHKKKESEQRKRIEVDWIFAFAGFDRENKEDRPKATLEFSLRTGLILD